MALTSLSGPPYCIQSETLKCKALQHNVVYSFTNNIEEESKVKEGFFGLRSSSTNSTKPQRSLHLDGTGGRRRGHRRVVIAASPFTEDVVVATEPLTKDDLVGYLASGCKPKEKWRFNFLAFFIETHIFGCIFFCLFLHEHNLSLLYVDFFEISYIYFNICYLNNSPRTFYGRICIFTLWFL